MTELLTAARMRAIETAAIDSGAVTGLELMERAGRGVVEAVFEEWPDLAAAPHRAVVLCGPGNNGGDGFVVARLLKERGWEVEVFLYGDPAKLPPDARSNHDRWVAMAGPVPELTHAAGRAIHDTEQELIVDALFGTGLTRGLPDVLGECARGLDLGQRRDPAPRIVAVDIPSGLSADTGQIVANGQSRDCFFADLTVTFHAIKAGHARGDGPRLCGTVVVKDIGL